MGLDRFHIHVDATILPGNVGSHLVSEFGFTRTDFAGHPAGRPHFEPRHHLTYKCQEPGAFRGAFEAIRRYLADTEFRGYLEGEYIASDLRLPVGPYNPKLPMPAHLELATLPRGQFRDAEIHIAMDAKRSDPRLIEGLYDAGLFGAFLPKEYGSAVILTAQGSRAIVAGLLETFTAFLFAAGGAVEGTIKEERVVRWWTSHSDIALPPVVAKMVASKEAATG